MEEIINKLNDLNHFSSGLYSITISTQGLIYLKNYNNPIFVTEDVQELREYMYKIILKQTS